MDKAKLQVELRNTAGKGANRKTRKEGMVPGVLYSPHDKENLLLKIKREELNKLLTHQRHSLINLEIIEGKEKNKRLAMIKDFQYNSLKKQIVHVDFYGVTLKEKLTIRVNIELVGESKGVKDGGIMDFDTREVEVECLPSAVPNAFRLDITNLEVGDHISVGDIEVPKGVKMLTDKDKNIVAVMHPSKEEVTAEEAESEEAEGLEADKVPSETKEDK